MVSPTASPLNALRKALAIRTPAMTTICSSSAASSTASSPARSVSNAPTNGRVAAVNNFRQHRVLLYTTCYNVLDGVTLTIRKLEHEILAAGHAVCVLTTISGDARNTNLVEEHPNRNVIFMDNAKPIPFIHDPHNPECSYQIGFSLSAAVKEQIVAFEPTIVHITCPDCTALHLIAYARQYEIPLMGTFHSNIADYMDHYPGLSWLKPILGAFFRHQYNFMQALYVPTPFIVHHLQHDYRMERITHLQVWGRGVDIDKFHPQHASLKFRRELNIANDAVVVCWVGRLVREKRVDIFCDTIRRLHAMGCNFHGLVIGAGPCEDKVKSLPNTTFTGWMSAEQLSVAYASCDIFLFPSSVETFGNVTLEAMASGLPVVVEANCSGHLVRDGVNGFACAAGDAEAFFQGTYQLVVDHERRQCFSRESRRLSLTLEKRVVVQRMLQNYRNVEDEFFQQYGGHHANRDAVYQNADSFVAGNHPRPLLLVMVEFLFVVLFQVIWNMTETFMYMQEAFGLVQRRRRQVPAPSRPALSPSRKAASSDPVILVVQSCPEEEIAPIEEDLEDPLVHSTSDDEETQSTVSSTDAHQESVASSSSSCRGGGKCFRSYVGGNALGDCKVSHVMAKAFIRSIQVQCRLESYMRNSCKTGVLDRRGGGSSLVGRRRKRKDSQDISRPDIIARVRSEPLDSIGSGSFDDEDVMTDAPTTTVALLDPSSAFENKNRLRRSQALQPSHHYTTSTTLMVEA